MKKTLLIVGACFAALMLFYGAISALVNQGHALSSSLVTFVLVIVGTAGLIWMVKSG
jgi:FtsH-binding integral membrane protein